MEKTVSTKELQILRYSLYFFTLLNFLDGLLTYIGVQTGYAVEVNPLLTDVVTTEWKTILVKILIPIILALYLWFRATGAHANMKSFVIIKKLVLYGNYFYVFLLFIHSIWIATMVYQLFLS